MNDYLINLTQQVEGLNVMDVAAHVAMSVFLGFIIYLSYYLAHAGTVYSRKFNVSLVVLTVLTGTVMSVIGKNIALSLGMVGALSIVRFRTAIKDSRDTVYIFWAIVAGLACGVGDYSSAGIGSAAVFVVLLILGRIKNENRVLLVVRGARSSGKAVKAAVASYYSGRSQLRAENAGPEDMELIFELSRRTLDKKKAAPQTIVDVLYGIDRIDYVSLVTQDDDIAG